MDTLDALRVCFFSHSPYLAGAERTLLEFVTQMIEDHGAQCIVVVPGDGPLIARLEAAGAEVLRTEYGWWCDVHPGRVRLQILPQGPGVEAPA